MKALLITLIMVLSVNIGWSQTEQICLAFPDYVELKSNIATILQRDSINNEKLDIYEDLVDRQSDLISVLEIDKAKLTQYKDDIDIYTNRLEKDLADIRRKQSKWYNKKENWFIAGVLTTLGVVIGTR
jgi:hypothetical protein